MIFWRIVNSELFNIRSIPIQISERFSLSLDLTTHDLQTYIFDLFPSKKETRRPVQGSSLSGNRDYDRNCRTNRTVIDLFQYRSLIQNYTTVRVSFSTHNISYTKSSKAIFTETWQFFSSATMLLLLRLR